MNTSKSISTISYNSLDWLKTVLNGLRDAHIISDWMYITHEPEEDEKKRHTHVWMQPNKRVDTMSLQDRFNEFDPSHPDKPLGVIDFKSSNPDDWILYSEHDDAYLASKNEGREFAYLKSDFVYADEDTFDERYRHAHRGSEWAHRQRTLSMLKDGTLSEYDAIMRGTLPIQTATALVAIRKLNRGGRPGHD